MARLPAGSLETCALGLFSKACSCWVSFNKYVAKGRRSNEIAPGVVHQKRTPPPPEFIEIPLQRVMDVPPQHPPGPPGWPCSRSREANHLEPFDSTSERAWSPPMPPPHTSFAPETNSAHPRMNLEASQTAWYEGVCSCVLTSWLMRICRRERDQMVEEGLYVILLFSIAHSMSARQRANKRQRHLGFNGRPETPNTYDEGARARDTDWQ